MSRLFATLRMTLKALVVSYEERRQKRRGNLPMCTTPLRPSAKNFFDRIYRMNVINSESWQLRRCRQVPSPSLSRHSLGEDGWERARVRVRHYSSDFSPGVLGLTTSHKQPATRRSEAAPSPLKTTRWSILNALFKTPRSAAILQQRSDGNTVRHQRPIIRRSLLTKQQIQ